MTEDTTAYGDTPPAEGDAVAAPADRDWDASTVEELREHARSHGINLHGASAKDDIAAAIRAHHAEQADDPDYDAATAPGGRDLDVGAAGDDVRHLQRILNAWYPMESPQLPTDGRYTDAVADRVRLHQSRHGIEPTGRVDAAGWRQLRVTR